MEEQQQQNRIQGQDGPKRLFRSRRHRLIGGVCGGAGEYFGVDPTLLRIAFVLLTFAGGWGIIAYIIGLIVIPEGPASQQQEAAGEQVHHGRSGLLWGSALIIAGLALLLHNYGWWPWPMWRFYQLSWRFLWPFLLIFIGLVLLVTRTREQGGEKEGQAPAAAVGPRRLYRSRKERMLGGVCGGIADHFRIDPTLVRLLWAFGTVLSHGLGLIAYIILWVVLQEEPQPIESVHSNSEVQG